MPDGVWNPRQQNLDREVYLPQHSRVLCLTEVMEHAAPLASRELPADDVIDWQAADADTRSGCGNAGDAEKCPPNHSRERSMTPPAQDRDPARRQGHGAR